MRNLVLDNKATTWIEALPARRALVMGMARSGIAAAGALARLGAKVVATDLEEVPGLGERLPPGVVLELGGHDEARFEECDLLVVSPGIPATNRYIALAKASGAEVIGEVELASRLCSAPIAAVTGTNGKTTVTTMLGRILEESGFRAPVGGNIGRALVEVVEAEGDGADFIVGEVSSFQLEWAPTLKPKVGVMTNVTPDHLDRHPDIHEYAGLKARLFANQGEGDAKILNADDPLTARYMTPGPQSVLAFSRKGRVRRGAYVEQGDVFLADEGGSTRVCGADELLVPGLHNLENFLAACAAAHFLGADVGVMARVARSFEGLPHRMEVVGEMGGVRWVNDSKGTNVGATAMSLESVTGDVLLIAGGVDKGGDLTPLRTGVERKVRRMILIGEAAERFGRFFDGCAPLAYAKTLDEAVRISQEEARAGDTVLLSPACSSFDQFRDYAHRGDAFRKMVQGLTGRDAN